MNTIYHQWNNFLSDLLKILRQTNSSTSSNNQSQNTGGGSGNSLNLASVPKQFIDPSFHSASGSGSTGSNAASGTYQQNFIDPSTFLNPANSQTTNGGSGSNNTVGSSVTNQLQQPGSMGNPMQFLSPGIFGSFQTLNSNGGSSSNPALPPQSGTGSSSVGISFSGTFFQPSQFLNPGTFLVGRKWQLVLHEMFEI